MKRRKNIAAKVIAFIALSAIIIGIVGTSILFIVSSFTDTTSQNLTSEQIQEFIDTRPEAQLNNS
jgi:ABC-type transport system involved in multi-copper enzyme maturation permease subunit